ncbi:hypothetical protein JCM16358_05410 [Halanaerocella petrolearia]
MKKRSKVIILLLCLLTSYSIVSWAKDDYFTVVDKKSGDVVFETAMEVSAGDYYINEENKKYKIVKVNGKQAKAELEKKVKLVGSEEDRLALAQGLLAQKNKKLVALYHTHGAESYKPTSGTDSEPGKGDIRVVSHRLAKALEAKGIEVRYKDANHEPHDGGAYERSRRTAMKLVRNRPDALLDIHRDGVPDAREYITKVNEKKAARVRLVVGRQNPQIKVVDKFAKQFKAVTDKYYPGLVKGIYYARGKYNQDLSPRSLLLEFGTHVIPQQLAVNTTNLVANSINKLLYGAQGELPDKARAGENRSSFSSIMIILVIAIIGGGLFLVANEGSLAGAISRFKNTDDSSDDS